MKKRLFLTLAAAAGLAVVVFAFAAASGNQTPTQWNLKNSAVIDLSYSEDQTLPCDPSLKKATLDWFARVGQGEGAYWNLETISYCPHTGTHMDAPFHVNSSWGAVESLDPTVLIGPAVVLNVRIPQEGYSITAADIKSAEARTSPIQPGDGVLIHTGHSSFWPNKDTYIDKGYPTLAMDAAQYIVSKKARFVGMEAISPDGPNTDTHKVLLGAGVIVVENLTNIEQIGQARCTTASGSV